MDVFKLTIKYPIILPYGKRRALQYLLDMVGQGYSDNHIIESIRHFDARCIYNEVIAHISSDGERDNRSNEAKEYLEMYERSRPRLGERSSKRQGSYKRPSEYLYQALELGKDDDKLLAEIILKTEELSRYAEANKALQSICKGSAPTCPGFSTWDDLAFYYCDVLINRGSAEGYWYKIERTKFAYGDIQKAIELAKEADAKGLANAKVYEFLGSYYEYVIHTNVILLFIGMVRSDDEMMMIVCKYV